MQGHSRVLWECPSACLACRPGASSAAGGSLAELRSAGTYEQGHKPAAKPRCSGGPSRIAKNSKRIRGVAGHPLVIGWLLGSLARNAMKTRVLAAELADDAHRADLNVSHAAGQVTNVIDSQQK